MTSSSDQLRRNNVIVGIYAPESVDVKSAKTRTLFFPCRLVFRVNYIYNLFNLPENTMFIVRLIDSKMSKAFYELKNVRR